MPPSRLSPVDPSETSELYIEFDGAQLVVKTDDPEARDYFRRHFLHMLVPRVTASVGDLEILRCESGYTLRSAETRNLPRVKLESLLPLAKDEVRLQFMRSRPDLLWLHAGAVERHGTAILLAGPSGQGKSTLATLLCERGWSLLSDDIAPVRMDADEVLPFAQCPVRRIPPGREVQPNEVLALDRQPVPIDAECIRCDPVRIGGIVFLRFTHGASTELSRLTRGAAAFEMLRNATNFVDHKKEGVRRAAEMARALPAFRLIYGSPKDAVPHLDTLA